MLIENMTLAELDVERKRELRRIDAANAALEKIHGQKNYQDEVAKYFVGGMVGFRKDRKRVTRSINQYTDNAVKACELYDAISNAKSRIFAIDRAINFIAENKAFGETERQIKDRKRELAIEAAPLLKWEKVTGHYGVAYRHAGLVVERVDPGFVAVRDDKGNLLSHYKTVKEAKAGVAGALGRGEDKQDDL